MSGYLICKVDCFLSVLSPYSYTEWKPVSFSTVTSNLHLPPKSRTLLASNFVFKLFGIGGESPTPPAPLLHQYQTTILHSSQNSIPQQYFSRLQCWCFNQLIPITSLWPLNIHKTPSHTIAVILSILSASDTLLLTNAKNNELKFKVFNRSSTLPTSTHRHLYYESFASATKKLRVLSSASFTSF